ncbi:MAG: histidine triad nucleotide-binding protein [Chloroflexi bacterium]|nr:MAG: histidine triad nucleotide-binding protein [Chloroflexota bacterium]
MDPRYDPENVFARILRGEIPSDRVFEDAEFVAFRDIQPAAPTHIVIAPRGEPPTSAVSLSDADAGWLGRMLVVASKIAAVEGLDSGGYRLVVNCGDNAGQTVGHFHLHLLGGRSLGPVA